jgi:molecular chaperone DnaK (HSP70)
MSNYLIGIDLGTTNCTMAFVKKDETKPNIEQFMIPQVTANETEGESLALPSFLYFPLNQELNAKIAGISWDPKRQYCVGLFARERGAELPSRLIASAKSWLCHSGINRRDKLLPLIADNDSEKMSPLEACASILQHLREAWDSKMSDAPFNEQQILITVPASFDPSARQLVQEASTLAGYPEIILLEEPQAAFYAWLHDNAETWRSDLSVGDTILVVDIGGGTTDFSLISVAEENGDLVLQRQAVGAHLLLGGDNIDLCLAYLAKNKLEEQGHHIDDWQLQALVHTCRQAKEKLMSAKPPKSVDITIMGRSTKLIGGTLKTQITKEEAHQLILEGFAPLTKPTMRSETEKRSGIQQIGLPYAQDARISCQLAKFLSMSSDEDTSMDKFVLPSAVLFNGGTMKSDALRERIVELLNEWAKTMKKEPIKVLPNPDLDFAVSRGAVNYGMARDGKAIRIKSGTSCSYFIGVEDAVPAVPGMSAPLKAICVVPFGMEEGSESELSNQEFALVLGEPSTFRFFSRNTRQMTNGDEPVVGSVVKTWKKELTELHPVETLLDKSDLDGKTVCVKLKSKVTELGVLELWCAANDGRKWKLEFDIR